MKHKLLKKIDFVLLLALLAIFSAPPSSAQNVAPLATPQTAQRDRIVEIQTLLSLLGYNAGPADGVAGRLTIQAILQFQKAQKLPSTGRPTANLVKQLRLAAAPPVPEPPPQTTYPDAGSARKSTEPPATTASTPVDTPAVTLTRWKIIDPSGAQTIVLFERNGQIGEVANSRFWHWEQNGPEVTITYDDGWGAHIIRRGTLADDVIFGEAESRGMKWRWQAEKLPQREERSPFRTRSGIAH